MVDLTVVDPYNLVEATVLFYKLQALKISANKVNKEAERECFVHPGIYILCYSDNKYYIGESEYLYKRLNQHLSGDKADWKMAFVFSSSDWDKSSIRYLEDRFVGIARANGNNTVLTKKTSSDTKIADSRKSLMERYIKLVHMLLAVFGCDVLEAQPKQHKEEVRDHRRENEAPTKTLVSWKDDFEWTRKDIENIIFENRSLGGAKSFVGGMMELHQQIHRCYPEVYTNNRRKALFRKPGEIAPGVYIEKNRSNNDHMKVISELAEKIGFQPEDIRFEVKSKNKKPKSNNAKRKKVKRTSC